VLSRLWSQSRPGSLARVDRSETATDTQQPPIATTTERSAWARSRRSAKPIGTSTLWPAFAETPVTGKTLTLVAPSGGIDTLFTVLTTNQKGAVAETAVIHEAIKLGIGVFKPIADERCDFIFDLHPRLVRVQCKWAPREGDVVVIRLYSARRTALGLKRTLYHPDEVDAFAVYCPDTCQCYFVEMTELVGRVNLHLRLEATKNNQRDGVNWARDYEFAAKLKLGLGP